MLLIAIGVVLAFLLNLREANGAILLPLTAAQIPLDQPHDRRTTGVGLLDRTPGVMRQPPRPPDSPLLDRPSLHFVVGAGSLKALLALGILGLVPWLGYGHAEARTVAFHVMAIGQLLRQRTRRATRGFVPCRIRICTRPSCLAS